MKVLFVYSANNNNNISPIVKNQGISLEKQGIEIEYFGIKGKGTLGYLSNIKHLRKIYKKSKPDIVHAHYSLSAFVSSLAMTSPLVVSLMGSDVKAGGKIKSIIKLLNKLHWKSCIVKSLDMKNSLGIKEAKVIPNGVDFDLFKPYDQRQAQKKLNWDNTKKHLLFAADPERHEKNFQLTKKAFQILRNENIELHYLKSVNNNEMPYYYSACDIMLLTSLWEGSPNVIKEAMACNCKIISTDVGDVKKVIENTKGCLICKSESEDLASKISILLTEEKTETNGREQIAHLKSDNIAQQIIKIYTQIIAQKDI